MTICLNIFFEAEQLIVDIKGEHLLVLKDLSKDDSIYKLLLGRFEEVQDKVSQNVFF
jgi:hypothetical protein